MQSLVPEYRAVVFGSSGGIGSSFLKVIEADDRCKEVIGFSRTSDTSLDLTDERSIAEAADSLRGDLHLLIDATGFLSDEIIKPEKSLRSLESGNFAKLFELNATGPALLMKHFSKHMPKSGKSVFATLSARVGSIGDNHLGGWYAYRASKAALNMLIKCTSIEISRTRPDSVFVSMHPGTVATSLSGPFSGSRETMSPDQSAKQMLQVLDGLTPEQTGSFWDYKGDPIEW